MPAPVRAPAAQRVPRLRRLGGPCSARCRASSASARRSPRGDPDDRAAGRHRRSRSRQSERVRAARRAAAAPPTRPRHIVGSEDVTVPFWATYERYSAGLHWERREPVLIAGRADLRRPPKRAGARARARARRRRGELRRTAPSSTARTCATIAQPRTPPASASATRRTCATAAGGWRASAAGSCSRCTSAPRARRPCSSAACSSRATRARAAGATARRARHVRAPAGARLAS